MSKYDDAASREMIIYRTDLNLFVEAGAGSGKTYSLVKRMTSMILSGISIEKICAITFTKAAANEFYSRFFEDLKNTRKENKFNEKELTEQQKEFLDNAIKNIDLCFMGTIDSFCNMILSEHPNKAGIPSDARVLSNEEMDEVYIRELSNIEKGVYGEELKDKFEQFKRCHSKPADIFVKIMSVVANHKDAEIQIPEFDLGVAKKELETIKGELIFIWDNILKNNPENQYKPTKDNRKAFRNISTKSYSLRNDWFRNLNTTKILLSNFPKLRLPLEINYSNSAGFLKRTSTAKLHYFTIDTNDYIKKIDDIIYVISLDFIVSACKAISEKLKAEGKLSYFDYLFYLRNILKEDIKEHNCELIRHIYDRHSYFLIDEFQDTNPLQAEIFFYLSAENPVSNWKECKPRNGSLFIVGDPKQSIYRFRNADVQAFLEVKSIFEKNVGEVVELTRNFRSSKEMCEYFNKQFPEVLDSSNENQSAFSPVPTEENDSFDDVFHGVFKYESEKEDSEANLCKIIKTLVGNENYQTYGLKKNRDEKRPFRYSDFMVIVKAKDGIPSIEKAFKENGIPCFIEGANNFALCDSIIELTRLYSAVIAPNDSNCLYNALTGKTFGLSENDIAEYVLKGNRLSVYSADENTDEIVEKALAKIKTSSDFAKISSPVAVLTKISNDYQIFKAVSTDILEGYYYIIELLKKAETDRTVTSHKSALEFLNKTIFDKSDIERCLSLSKDSDCVHIANLHKVKGLEAPVVILAKSSGDTADPYVYVAEENGQKKSWIFAVKGGKFNNIKFISISLFEEENNIEKYNLHLENDRLRYVAATRAGSVLITEIVDKKDSCWTDLIPSDAIELDLSSLEIPQTDAEKSGESAETLYQKASEENVISDNQEVKAETYSISLPSKQKHDDEKIQSKVVEEAVIEEKEEVSADALNAAIRGTIVHRLMEVLVLSDGKIELEKVVEKILDEQEITDERYREMLLKVGKVILNGGFEQIHGAKKDILAEVKDAEKVYCEMPFCYKEGNIIHNGIMDLVYFKDGKWQILDYKTNADGSALPEEYKGQMAAYKKALSEADGINPDDVLEPVLYHIPVNTL